MAVDYTPSFDPADVDSDYGSTGGDITVPTFTANMKPFRFWCQHALPLVYDDSLSYYEVLCKVVDQMNGFLTDLQTATGSIEEFAQQFVINQTFLNNMATKLGQDVDTLETYINERMEDFTTAYNQLQSYVNNYFDNLDVQQEINNKLDAMADDGTFNTLFNPVITAWMTEKTSQIDTAISNQDAIQAQQNARISVLEGRMDSFSSLPSGSTSGNAELLDIRTNFLGETYPTAGDAVRASDMIASGFQSIGFTRLEDWDGNKESSTYDTIVFDVAAYKGGHVVVIANTENFVQRINNAYGASLYGSNVSGKTVDNTAVVYPFPDGYSGFTNPVFKNYTVLSTSIQGEERIMLQLSIPNDFPFQYLKLGGIEKIHQTTHTTPEAIVYATSWSKTPVDATLTIAGAAADAKATGDSISSLNERLDDEINDLNTELYGNPGIISNTIPTSFISSDNHCTLSLVGYAGKKAFISNKNLFPNYPPLSSNGVTLTPNADGSITLSGTSTGVAAFQLSGNVMPTVGNGTFTLSANNTVAIGDNTTYINPSINGSYGNIACRLNTVDATETFTLGENDRITAIRIRISSGVTLPDNYKLFIQLEEGEQKTEFVEHQGYIIDITQATIETNCFDGYNYVTAQVDVTGTVSYVVREGGINDQITDLDNRVEALENQPTTNYKKFIGKKIVCFGDSITGNFPAPIDYPSMIAELTGATVYNAGFGGCCMSDNGQRRKDFTMCRLVDSIVAGDFSAQWNSGVSITYAGTSTDYVPERLTMLEGIDWSKIDYITIAYGTNDWNSNYGLDNDNNPLDTTTYIGAFRYSVEKLLTAYPNLKIMVITPLWRWWDTNTGMPSEIQADYIDSNDYAKGTGYKLWQYGDALVSAAKMYHIPVFDIYWNCMMTKQNRLEYFNYNDGTHPKLEGRELMADLISSHMESVY